MLLRFFTRLFRILPYGYILAYNFMQLIKALGEHARLIPSPILTYPVQGKTKELG